MKSFGVTSVLLLTLLLASLSVCEAQVRLQPSELCSDHSDAAIATFEDAELEAEVRGDLRVGAQEDLTCGVISGMTELATGASGEIESLVGIQNLADLQFLSVPSNLITDITPLSGLASLFYLDVTANSITDITPLRGLTSMMVLSLRDNSITNISALSGLTSLELLHLNNNPITDISPLSGLTSLGSLRLPNTSISDISALSGLTSLGRLDLENNSITDISALSGLTSLTGLFLGDKPALTDIQPLVDNAGLGAGDTVNLMSTNVSCTDVAALKSKGVTVVSLCP